MPERSSESPQAQVGSGPSPPSQSQSQQLQQQQQQQQQQQNQAAAASAPSSSNVNSGGAGGAGGAGAGGSGAGTSTTLPGFPPSTLSRPFRSRKNRPCDACVRLVPLPPFFYFSSSTKWDVGSLVCCFVWRRLFGFGYTLAFGFESPVSPLVHFLCGWCRSFISFISFIHSCILLFSTPWDPFFVVRRPLTHAFAHSGFLWRLVDWNDANRT